MTNFAVFTTNFAAFCTDRKICSMIKKNRRDENEKVII